MPSGPTPASATGRSGLPPVTQRGVKWRAKNSGTLSALEVAQLWVDAGGPANEAFMASVVSKYESRRRVRARGPLTRGARAHGLMQIYPNGPFNAWENMKAAVAKYEANGWQPWSVCNATRDAYKEGTRDCANLRKEADRLERRYKGKLDQPDGSVFDQIGGAIDKVNPIDDVAGAISTIFKPIADFFAIITSADTWMRVGKVLLGALILLIVAYELMGGTNRLARKVRG